MNCWMFIHNTVKCVTNETTQQNVYNESNESLQFTFYIILFNVNYILPWIKEEETTEALSSKSVSYLAKCV